MRNDNTTANRRDNKVKRQVTIVFFTVHRIVSSPLSLCLYLCLSLFVPCKTGNKGKQRATAGRTAERVKTVAEE